MSELNESPGRSGGAESAIEEKRSAPAPKSKNTDESDGSIWSHLLFGVGTLVFVLPMLIPGIPMVGLVAIYGGLFAAVIIGFVLWSVFNRLKERRPKR